MLLGSNKPNKNVCCVVGRNVTKKRAAAVVVKHGLQELAPQGLALEQGAPHKRERQLGEVLDGGVRGAARSHPPDVGGAARALRVGADVARRHARLDGVRVLEHARACHAQRVEDVGPDPGVERGLSRGVRGPSAQWPN